MPSKLPLPYRAFASETHGALALVLFCVPALVFSTFLTVLKFRTQYRCDGFLQNTCGAGCSIALADPSAVFLGLPLSVYATGYYFALLVLALFAGLSPRDFAAAARFPVLLLATAGLAVAIALVSYARFALHTFCSYCAVLYAANAGIYLAALLLNPEGPLRGLVRGLFRVRGVGIMVVVVAVLAFLAPVMVQKRIWAHNVAAVLRGETHPSCFLPGAPLPETHFRFESIRPPAFVIALFVDLGCVHCKAEYKLLREYQQANEESVQLEVFHFPADSACGPLSTGTPERQNSCNASLALECLHDLAPGQEPLHLDKLFAMQDLDEPYFSPAHLGDLANELNVPGLIECMNKPETRERVERHIRFGVAQRLTGPPSALVIPVERHGSKNWPTGRMVGLRGGGKPAEYIDSILNDIRSKRKPNE